jgi:hypothetical protein
MELTPSATARPCSFLALPPAIRQQIYYYAGLVCNYDIDLNRRSRPYNDERSPYSARCTCSAAFQTSHNLLLTCRTIYAEASEILYSTNRFIIHYSREYNHCQTLKRPRNLSPESIAHLTQLTIYLNHPGSNNAPPENASEGALSGWQSTTHITTHIRPSRLRMYFICDVDGLGTAIDALKPFCNIPKPADCGIRLSRHLDPRLQDLAQSTAMQAMGYWQCSNRARSLFRFFDLLRELRLQILEYTDLVTPNCEVEWNPERNYYLRYIWGFPMCVGPNFGVGPGCSYVSGCMCQYEKSWIEDPWNPMWQMRFCRRSQAAFSSRCHC